jgi:succinate dehydrogenase/fumarate reductase flavoprotein subunit
MSVTPGVVGAGGAAANGALEAAVRTGLKAIAEVERAKGKGAMEVDSKAGGMVEEEEEEAVVPAGMDLPIGERRALTALLGVQAAQEELVREMRREVLEVERKVRFRLFVCDR